MGEYTPESISVSELPAPMISTMWITNEMPMPFVIPDWFDKESTQELIDQLKQAYLKAIERWSQ